jgi:hypothetical protein
VIELDLMREHLFDERGLLASAFIGPVGTGAVNHGSSRGTAGGFSGIRGCTPSTASQCAVQRTIGGSTSFSL